MNNEETVVEPDNSDGRRRKARKPNAERKVFFHYLDDGVWRDAGNYPESFIGAPLERKIPIFAQEMYGGRLTGSSEMKADVRKANGNFEKSYSFTVGELPEETALPSLDQDFYRDEEAEEIPHPINSSQLTTAEVENVLLKERLKRIEDDLSRQKAGNQSEMQTLISALEESRREQRELMMLMINQASRPQQDATTQAMNILEKSLGIVTKAKAISEEIAPNETASESTIVGDAAKLVDSIGRNAGTFLPLVSRFVTPAAPAPSASGGTGNQSLAESFRKAKGE